jgi:HAE1 family hydrophobic/amphiphilic exporter-1
MTSNSSQGTCTVLVQLVDGYDPNQADIDIQQALGPVLRQLPTGASAPVVRKFDPNASPILNLAFTGAPLDELYDIATNQIQPALASVPGVGQVNPRQTARDQSARLHPPGRVRHHVSGLRR